HIRHCFKCYSEIQQACLEKERHETTHECLHPLKGKPNDFLKNYLLGQLFLLAGARPEGAGLSFRRLVQSLDMQANLDNILKEAPLYDDIGIEEVFNGLYSTHDDTVMACFLCDFTRLHTEDGGADTLPVRWRHACKEIFRLNDLLASPLEHLCKQIAAGQQRESENVYSPIPESVIEYFLPMKIEAEKTSQATGDYLVIDISAGPKATFYPHRYTNARPNPKVNTCWMSELWLRRVPAGTSTMGAHSNGIGRDDNETQHPVKLSDDFYIGVFPVTQRQWELVMGRNPSTCLASGYCAPVEYVSYDDICGKQRGWPLNPFVSSDSFLGLLNTKTRLGTYHDSHPKGFDIPTEAQWEYACRAGTMTSLNSNQDLTGKRTCDILHELGWYKNNSGGMAHPVGEKRPNAWGLYDMHGNVGEWCRDWLDAYCSDHAVISDPKGGLYDGRSNFDNTHDYEEIRENLRVYRGGDWACRAKDCRAATRGGRRPQWRSSTIGFRLVFVSAYHLHKSHN
ncbi:MAG: formylglycine-generating enzyme family protein, partial [Lentisphaeria bacterium]|nr:formylglycine-generating enzyme family protein [Lentisphaeria bacterium]